MKYTIKDLQSDFPDEDSCLEWLVNYLYPDGITCKTCREITKHYKLTNRKAYSCVECRTQVYPTAGTIWHKSSTPLTLWFYAMFVMANTRSGISAATLQRELGVTYKTAWRMNHQIRTLMSNEVPELKGEVEVDETYIHANVFKRSTAMQKYGPTGARKGQIIFGMVQRGGSVKVRHVKYVGATELQAIIKEHVKLGTKIYSDEHGAYRSLHKRGYRHFTTNHSKNEHVNGNNHTQNIENVWSHLKRGIKGCYRSVSATHLEKYANEYAWRYSHRNSISSFWALMGEISHPSSEDHRTVS